MFRYKTIPSLSNIAIFNNKFINFMMINNTKKFKYKTIFESNLDLDLRRHEGNVSRARNIA
jgi:hypothetical protein